MSYEICFRCGSKVLVGGLKYIINITIWADFDGTLLEPEGDVGDEIQRLLKKIENLDQETLEKDVCQDLQFIVCKRCKDQWVQDLLNTGGNYTPFDDEFPHFFH
ncbi:MAG: hypothetical protein ABID54_05790 [Pseudomonadota bacterium]